ncbi:Protein hir2 [Monosporozyma unispora]|nr:Protein hir2 [Kazachstania unispora]
MRLLKYPIELSEGESLTAMASIDDKLIILTNKQRVIVWVQKQLVDATFDKISIKDLHISTVFDLENFTVENDDTCFIMCQSDNLFIGSERKLFKVSHWNDTSLRKQDLIYSCLAPSIITDVKLDPAKSILFVLSSNSNKISLFNSHTLKCLDTITLNDGTKPMTCITDPSSQVLTVFCSNRSMLLYQYNEVGSYKLLHELKQTVQMKPLHYNISMPPQANMIPVINSIKNKSATAATTTVLLNRNDNYKVASTIVSPASNSCKVLRYSPVLYEKTNAKKGTKTRYNLLATSGSSAGSILVWNSKRMKPLFNAIQISESPINDMLWSDHGLTLFAISDDNILFTFAFLPTDLGEIVPKDQTLAMQKENKQIPPLPVKRLSVVDKPNETFKSETGDMVTIKQESSVGLGITSSQLDKLEGTPVEIPPKRKLNIPASVKHTQSTSMEFNQPSYSVPKDLKRKPKIQPLLGVGQTVAPLVKKQKKELEPIDFLDTGLLLPNVSFSRIRLATPKIRLSFSFSPPENSNLEFCVKNGGGNEQLPTKLILKSKLSDKNNQLFEDFIPKFVTMCTAGNFFWACCTEDGMIYVYNDSGKRLLPPLVMGVSISFLEATGDYLLCVTSLGEMFCWNVREEKLSFPTSSVFPVLNPSLRYSDDILTRAENITMCALTNNGVPLVTLSNGDGFMFDKNMETWLLISDSWWAYGSQYWDMNNTSKLNGKTKTSDNVNQSKNKYWNSDNVQELLGNIKNDDSNIINYIERRTNDELNRKNRIKNLQQFARAILMKEGFENMEEIVTLAHLENRLLVSFRLQEVKEFSDLVIVYCVRLGEMGYVERLDDVLQWIYNDGDFEKIFLANLSRKKVMKDILMACANIRHVQRVTTSYANILGIIKDVV